MKNLWRNERGAALILVLMLSMVITVGLTALILSTQQGQRNSVHDGNAERSNYIAESGAVIVKRLVKNAADNNVQVLNLNAAQLKVLEDVKPSFTLDGTNDMKISPFKEEGKIVVNIEGFSKFNDSLQKRTKITLPVLANSNGGGSGSNGNGIFGNDVVGTSVTEKNQKKTEQWVRHWDEKTSKESAPGQYYKVTNYQEQMTNHFTKQIDANRPVFSTSAVFPLQGPTAPIIPLEVLDEKNCSKSEFQASDLDAVSEIYCTKNIVISPKGMTKKTPIYTNGSITVRGDITNGTYMGTLSAKGNITFEGKIYGGEFGETISGGQIIFMDELNGGAFSSRLSARGDIEFRGNINGVTFSGDTLSGGSIYYKRVVNNITYSGRLSVQQNIVFEEGLKKGTFSIGLVAGNDLLFKRSVGDTGPVIISGLMESGGELKFFEPVRNVTASGRFVSGKAMTFNKEVGSNFVVSGSLHSHGGITFVEPVTNSTVSGGLYAKGDITFQKAIQGNSTLGEIKSGNNITFQNVDGSTITGDVIANGLLAFNGNLNEGALFKQNLVSNSANSDLKFSAGSRVAVEGSIYSARGIDFNQLNGVKVGKSVYAYKDIRMPTNLSYLNVTGAVLSRDGSVTFPKLFGCGSKDACYIGSFVAGTAGINFNYNLDGFMYFGGLSTAQAINYNGTQNGPPNTIRISRKVPEGYTEDNSNNSGGINFGEWRTTS
ncbi:hypothetical protein WMW72_11845 [Paenibacillus filicis]|uniref:Type 4 fimbrial biogenesis protein PilX N-terminal domain-containing protein n=1 Tax=Paenibacillus filicis TaxID=669464 RepID=A0ABU9DKJ2_9BACL